MPKRHRTTKTTKRGNSSKLAHPWLWVGIAGIVILLVAVGFLILPKGSTGALPAEITPEQAFQKYQQGAFFLDVRTLDDWKQVHIAKSTLIPLDELSARLGELPGDTDIVVVCLSGRRSKEGLSILQNAGFKRVTSLSGGLQAWSVAGYPVETP